MRVRQAVKGAVFGVGSAGEVLALREHLCAFLATEKGKGGIRRATSATETPAVFARAGKRTRHEDIHLSKSEMQFPGFGEADAGRWVLAADGGFRRDGCSSRKLDFRFC